MLVTGGSTDVTTYFKLRLAADGTAASGLTITDFDLQYVRSGAAPSAKVDATALAATDSAHGDNQAIEIDATDQPGLYRVDWPDAAFAAGVREVILTVKVATAFAEDQRVTIDAPVDVTKISGDSTAADNLELMYDGTGYTDGTAPSSRDQVGNLSTGSAAISTVAESATITTGTEAGGTTFTDSQTLNGVYHRVEDVGNTTDFYYQFDITGVGVPTEFIWNGFVQGNNDTYQVYAYNWGGTAFDQIGTIDGSAGETDQSATFQATTAHRGTGANLGKARLRFESSDGAEIGTDRVLCSYAVVAVSAGYADGAIWYDDAASNTNTEAYVDGVADNPVSTWAAVLTLIGSVGIKRVRIAAGSAVTLTGNSDDYALIGDSWPLALGGQSVEGMAVTGAKVTGIGTATVTRPIFRECLMNSCTIPPAFLYDCGVGNASGTLTAGSAGEYVFFNCYSVEPGAAAPALNFSGLGASTGVNVRGWRGGASYTLDSDCTLSHEVLAGGGTTIVTGGADCEIRGITRELDITMSAAETVQFVGITGPIALSGTTTATVNLYGVGSTVSDTTSAATVTNKLNIDANVSAVLVDTAEIGTAGAGLTNINLPNQTMDITGNLSGSVGSVTGSVGSLAAQAKTDVNAEVVDALDTDTYAEPGSPPAATASLTDKIGWLMALARNKLTQTATTQTLRNDADSGNIGTAAVSDDGTTATRGEWS